MSSDVRLKSFDFGCDDVTVANRFYSTWFFLKQLVLLIAGTQKYKLSKHLREQGKVLEDYERLFKKIFESKSWNRSNDIVDFMFPKISNEILEMNYKPHMVLNNRLCKVSLQEYSKYRPIPILQLLKEFTKNDEAIIEIGCGWGRNLFYLVALNFQNKLEGYEFTKYGLAAAEEINKHFGCNIKFGKIDLTKDLDSIDLNGKTVFTQKVMEQLKYNTVDVIKNLINAKPKQVLHIEPVYELYTNSLRDLVSKLYIKFADYQDNLLTTLKTFEKNGKLKILDVYRLGFAANPTHEDSFIRWVPIYN